MRVLLPLLRDDLDLEWADYDGDPAQPDGGPARRAASRPARRSACTASPPRSSCSRPRSRSTRAGRRLGQGGGSYDRALARTGAPVLAVVFDDEVIDEVPAEPHDRPVSGVLTPAGGIRGLRL